MAGMTSIVGQTLGAFQLINSVLSAVRPTANIIGDVFDLGDDREDDLRAMQERQLRQQNQLAQKQAAQRARLEKEELQARAEEAERQRRQALKRAVARQRASFGAQGVGSTGGSSQAVLLGMFEESEDEAQAREQLDQLRFKALDQGVSQSRRVNTLAQTQLREKNRITRGNNALNNASNVFGIFG